jgi:hypothetical protein
MKKISLAFVAALSLAAVGCNKKGADCGNAITNSMEISKANMQKMPGVDDKMMAKMKDIGLQHCKDDKWSDDALKCMSDAKTEADAQSCYGKLSHDQQEKMNHAIMDAMKSVITPPPPPPAPAATGSDMGSAGAAPASTGDTNGSAGSSASPK